MERVLRIYRRPDGREPVREWLEAMKDTKTRSRIEQRLDRITLGNLGDHKAVGGGVSELRLHFGPGFRVYFGEDGRELVVLLCGGDKASQPRDIALAQEYWQEFLTSKEETS